MSEDSVAYVARRRVAVVLQAPQEMTEEELVEAFAVPATHPLLRGLRELISRRTWEAVTAAANPALPDRETKLEMAGVEALAQLAADVEALGERGRREGS